MQKIKSSSLTETVMLHLKEYFEDHENDLPESGLYDRIMGEIERVLIIETFNKLNNNQIKTAIILGINRNTLRKKLIEYEIIKTININSKAKILKSKRTKR